MLEKSDMIWTSYMFNLDILPTHKLAFHNGENLHQISVNYVYRQVLNYKVED